MIRHLALLSTLLSLAAPCLAGEHRAHHPKGSSPAASAPAPSPEEQAAMAAWTKASTPGEHHAALQPIVGTFDATITMWMAAGAPPMVSTGRTVNKWVLGGRYLQQSHESEFNGEPFSGIGYTAYDNVHGKYVGTWMDTMGTGMMTSVGDQSTPTELTFTAKAWDAMDGQEKTFREKLTIKDRDNHVFEMWGAGPDGLAFRMMEIVYKRR